MAMAQLLGGAWLPGITFFNTVIPQFILNGRVIDASGEKLAWRVIAPKSGTIDTVEFCCAGVAQAPGSNGIKISLQDIDPADGDPDEVIDQFRNITSGFGSGVWMVPGLMTSDGTDGGQKRTVTRGEVLGIVWEFVSFQSGADFTIRGLDASPGSNPYFCHKLGGSWTKEKFPPTIAIKYDDGTYPYINGFGYPTASLGTTSIGTTTDPDEIAMSFSFPADVLVGGAAVRMDLDANVDVVIYDSQYNVIRSVSLDKDVRAVATMEQHTLLFPDFRAAANETYYLAVKPTTTTTVEVAWYTVNSAGMLDSMEGGGAWHYWQRVDGGGWVPTTTKRPWFNVLITGIDQESGGQPSMGFEGLT